MPRLLFLFAVLMLGAAVLTPPVRADETHKKIDDLGYQHGDQTGKKLLPYLKSEDPQHRWRAARALGMLGYAPAAPALAELLADKDPVVQIHAIIALGRIDDHSPATIDAIMLKVASPDARVARAALGTLKKMRPSPQQLAVAVENALQSDDQAVMTHALEAMVAAGGKAIPLLNELLENEKSAYWASVAIAEIGPDCAACAPGLGRLVSQCKDPQTLQQALLAIAALGKAGSPASKAVEQVAKDTSEPGTRIAACYALGKIGDSSTSGLLKQLGAEGGEFQQMVCAWSLANLHPDDPAAQQHAVQLLSMGLKSDRLEMREAAAHGLSMLKAPPEVTAPALLAALAGANEQQRAHISAALASIGPEVLKRAIPALQNPAFQDISIEVIGRLGPDAADAAAPLAALLPTSSEQQQARINFALASIGPAAASATPEIVKCLASSDQAVRQSALFALRQIGMKARGSMATVAAFMKSAKDPFEKMAAAWTLAAMHPEGAALKATLSELQAGLADADPQDRIETLLAIDDLGAAGKPLAAKVAAIAAKDPESNVRQAAADLSE